MQKLKMSLKIECETSKISVCDAFEYVLVRAWI